MKQPTSAIQIDEVGSQKFTLAVTFDGQRFDCGNYISRAAAMQAGRFADDVRICAAEIRAHLSANRDAILRGEEVG